MCIYIYIYILTLLFILYMDAYIIDPFQYCVLFTYEFGIVQYRFVFYSYFVFSFTFKLFSRAEICSRCALAKKYLCRPCSRWGTLHLDLWKRARAIPHLYNWNRTWPTVRFWYYVIIKYIYHINIVYRSRAVGQVLNILNIWRPPDTEQPVFAIKCNAARHN